MLNHGMEPNPRMVKKGARKTEFLKPRSSIPAVFVYLHFYVRE